VHAALRARASSASPVPASVISSFKFDIASTPWSVHWSSRCFGLIDVLPSVRSPFFSDALEKARHTQWFQPERWPGAARELLSFPVVDASPVSSMTSALTANIPILPMSSLFHRAKRRRQRWRFGYGAKGRGRPSTGQPSEAQTPSDASPTEALK
jgi:hypothetical protein